jgi:hypothetical protein
MQEKAMKRVPLLDLKAQHEAIGAEIESAVKSFRSWVMPLRNTL